MKKEKFDIKKAGWVANFIVRFLRKNLKLAENIFLEVFPGNHIHLNPPKGRKHGSDPDALQGLEVTGPGERMAYPEDPPLAF